MRIPRFVAGICCVLILASCNGGTMTEKTHLAALGSVPDGRLEKLLNSRLFFGHQSVGFNIIDGIRDVLTTKGGRGFTLTEARDLSIADGPGFYHSRIGQNGDPLGKIRDFEVIMRSGRKERLDVAFMKLCYVDVGVDTDVMAIFEGYRDTMTRLKSDFPETMFVHFTVPLVARQKGIKPLLKRLLGRQVRGYDDNLAREKLNSLLRNEYSGKEPLFDLALFESTRPDGSRSLLKLRGERYSALEDAYTDDGGHLNLNGRKVVAEQLLAFLAGIVR
jgi:hypothetical protein